MECTVSWTGNSGTRSGMGFVAETGSGHVLVMDGAPDAAKPENGGQNLAPRPMETVLAGTGGCQAVQPGTRSRVGAAVVDQHDFVVRIGRFLQQRADAALKQGELIFGGDDDGDQRLRCVPVKDAIAAGQGGIDRGVVVAAHAQMIL